MTFNIIRTLFPKKNRLTKNKWVLLLLVVVIVIGVYFYSHKNKENFTGDKILFEEDTLVNGRPVVLKNEGAFTDIAISSPERRQSLQYAALTLDEEIFLREKDGYKYLDSWFGKPQERADTIIKLRDTRIKLVVHMADNKEEHFITTLTEHSLQLYLPIDKTVSGGCASAFGTTDTTFSPGIVLLKKNWAAAQPIITRLFRSLNMSITPFECPRKPTPTMKEAAIDPNKKEELSSVELACVRSGLYTEDLSFPLIQYRAIGASALSGVDSMDARLWKWADEEEDGIMTTNLTIEEDGDKKFIIPTTNDIVEWVTALLTDQVYNENFT